MADDELTPEELEAQEPAQLPDREAMSLLDPGLGTAAPPMPIEDPYPADLHPADV